MPVVQFRGDSRGELEISAVQFVHRLRGRRGVFIDLERGAGFDRGELIGDYGGDGEVCEC